MILSFANKDTEKLWVSERSKHLGNIARIALRNSRNYTRRSVSAILLCRQGIVWRRFRGIEEVNTRSASMINGECVLSGLSEERKKSKFVTTIEFNLISLLSGLLC